MNHTTTTTVLIAIAAVTATLLAAGTVAADVGSNHSAFAHYKKGYKEAKSNGIPRGISNKQIILCITYGDNSPNTCSALLNLGPSPMKQGSSYTPSASQQSSPMKPSSTTTTNTPNVVHTSSPMKQGSSYTPSASQQSSPMKPSSTTTTNTPNTVHTNLSGSYPQASTLTKPSTTSTPLKFNTQIKFPFDLPG
jgi:hypothetical protein